jgi:hypothetical protein
MKKLISLLLFFFSLTISLHAQHALTGTWQLIKTTGVNADGEKFSLDTTQVREIKIITPTHYMLIAHDVDGDSLTFNRCYAGKVTVTKNQYIETPLMSSLQIVDNVQTDFTWKLEKNHFIQSGTVIRPDGKKVQVELVFSKVTNQKPNPAHPAIGTWNILSSSLTTPDGRKVVEKSPDVQIMEVITPTHWMGISYRKNKFENAMYGTYSLKQNKLYPEMHFSLLKMEKPKQFELTVQAEGDKLKVNGLLVNSFGTSTWEDICERMH